MIISGLSWAARKNKRSLLQYSTSLGRTDSQEKYLCLSQWYFKFLQNVVGKPRPPISVGCVCWGCHGDEWGSRYLALLQSSLFTHSYLDFFLQTPNLLVWYAFSQLHPPLCPLPGPGDKTSCPLLYLDSVTELYHKPKPCSKHLFQQ